MKNFIQPGDSITIPAPAAVGSGDGVQVGSLFGVASTSADAGAQVALATRGVFELPKEATADSFAIGDPVEWGRRQRPRRGLVRWRANRRRGRSSHRNGRRRPYPVGGVSAMAATRALFKQIDVERVLRAVKKVGLYAARVHIAKDGSIDLYPSTEPVRTQVQADLNPFDERLK